MSESETSAMVNGLKRKSYIEGLDVLAGLLSGGMERPDLGKIVDEVFRAGNEERVAVLVCGPARMARELRKHVGKWVGRGREVWFHDESFGW